MAPPTADSAAAPLSGSDRFARQRERILDAATTLLNQHGVQGMKFGDVARALELTTTSVTYYFRYKEQLAAAVFEDSLSLLEAMAREASRQSTPQKRVARYLEVYFDRHVEALRRRARPLAILSEIRALEEPTRRPLIEHYQRIFRIVRGFFGSYDERRKSLFTARAQMLNEALFWSVAWLDQYAISDFDRVRRRMFDILERGIAAPGADWTPRALDPDVPDAERPGRTAFLRVATRLINEIGYRGTSVERIAGELNLTKGSFYHHLNAKDDLILACFRDSFGRILRLRQLVENEGATRWHQLSSIIGSSLRVQFDGMHPLLRSTALQAMPAAVRDHAMKLSNRTASCLAGMLADGIAEGSVRPIDPMIASQMILSTINSAFDIRAWASRQPGAQAIEIYAGTLARGIFDV